MPDTTSGVRGLPSAEARRLLASCGANQVAVLDQESLLEEMLDSLREPLVLLLLVVGGLYLVFGELRDALIIFGVILTVALTEATIEWRAGRAIAALSALAEPKALVWRDGILAEVATEQVVPEDLIELRAGSRVPADARLVESSDLALDESLVTGESHSVERDAANPETAELHAGSAVVRGRGRALVTRTGASSTLGRIAELVAQTREPKTPLQRRMGELARALLWVAIAVSIAIPAIGVVAGRPVKEMLLTGLSLAFATIPEELPVLIVVVLGLGSLRLARRGAIIRRLIATETLGAVTIVCTDKTGTLTENRMTLTEALTPAALISRSPVAGDAAPLLRAAALASEVSALDPVDKAVREAASARGLADDGNVTFPFDRSVRLASGYIKAAGAFDAGVKGAPEAVLAGATAWRDIAALRPLNEAARGAFAAVAAELGSTGRVLGVGSRQLNRAPKLRAEIETNFVFEGLVVLRDPVRTEVPEAGRTLAAAGVKISIITGDQASTARAIAREAGIPEHHALTGGEIAGLDDAELVRRTAEGAVVARAQPADKLHIVQALGKAGEVVMVTGDGVNDAPALRAAAIGVAMGRVGSDVARQAAQVVLTNDSFATLVRAVAEGRRLYDNFRKAIRYYLAVKVALVLAMIAPAIMGLPLPFTPVQIVILELFMDLGASLAFVSLPAEAGVMARPPRDPAARFLDPPMLSGLFAGALTLAGLVSAAFWIGLDSYGIAGARTLALVVWLVGHATLGVAMAGRSGLRGLAQNPALLIWLAASGVFAALLVALPVLHQALRTGAVPPGVAALWAVAAVVVPLWLLAVGPGRPNPAHLVASPVSRS